MVRNYLGLLLFFLPCGTLPLTFLEFLSHVCLPVPRKAMADRHKALQNTVVFLRTKQRREGTKTRWLGGIESKSNGPFKEKHLAGASFRCFNLSIKSLLDGTCKAGTPVRHHSALRLARTRRARPTLRRPYPHKVRSEKKRH